MELVVYLHSFYIFIELFQTGIKLNVLLLYHLVSFLVLNLTYPGWEYNRENHFCIYKLYYGSKIRLQIEISHIF